MLESQARSHAGSDAQPGQDERAARTGAPPRSGAPPRQARQGQARQALTTQALLWLYLAMRQVKIAELKDRLSEHLRAVESGAEVVVMNRNRAIARIVPLPPPGRHVRLIQPNRGFPEIRDRRRAPAGWPVPSTELLLEERRDR